MRRRPRKVGSTGGCQDPGVRAPGPLLPKEPRNSVPALIPQSRPQSPSFKARDSNSRPLHTQGSRTQPSSLRLRDTGSRPPSNFRLRSPGPSPPSLSRSEDPALHTQQPSRLSSLAIPSALTGGTPGEGTWPLEYRKKGDSFVLVICPPPQTPQGFRPQA